MTLAAENLEYAYKPGPPVLRSVSATFPARTITAIVGPNGAGKSTLLRTLLGVLRPAAGRATCLGQDVAGLPRHERATRLAYVPQRSDVVFAFSTREVVRLGRYAADRGEDAASVQGALEMTDLADRAEDAFGVLSAGQQQRATLARALAQLGVTRAGPPDLSGRCLLLDEPVSAMDPPHALAAMGLLRTIAERGACVVVILHDLSLALRFADRAVVLERGGRVVAEGLAREVLSSDTLERAFGVRFAPLFRPGSDLPRGLEPSDQ